MSPFMHRRRAFALCGAVWLGAWASAQAQGSRAPAIGWASIAKPGSSLTLDDPPRVEKLVFGSSGLVRATVGTKSGPLAGFILYGVIAGKRLQLAEDPEQTTVYDRLDIRSQSSGVLVVQRQSGQIVRYRVDNDGK